MLFNLSVMSNSLLPHGLQHTRLLCPPLSPGICSNSCLSGQWCYISISSSVTPFFVFNQIFSNELTLCFRWSKYWSCSFSDSTSSEYSELISFRFQCFNLLADSENLKRLLQHHNWKASILCLSVFSMDQHSQLYMTTEKVERLMLWVMNDAGINGLQRREIQSGARDEAWSLRAFHVAKFY